MGKEMRTLGRCVGLAPLQGEKTQLRENTEGGCSRERFKSFCLERQVQDIPVCEEQGKGSLPWLSHPHKCPVCVFPLRPSL